MTNPIQRLKTNARLSAIVVANHVAYVAGQVPQSNGASVADQTVEGLSRIDELLALAGSDKTALLTASVWLTEPRHFNEFNRAWEAWVPQNHAPARACVQAGLMRPGIDVEVAVTALVPAAG